MNNHCSKNRILDSNQHGFRARHSTATQLLEATQTWAQYLNAGSSVDVVYFDFKKAFDKVNHKMLLLKLHRYNFCHKMVTWAGNFLSDRHFCVKIGEGFSEWAISPSGVPQGSVIGPALFGIFINDIGAHIPSSVQYKIYADDIKVYCAVDSAENRASLQAACDGILEWARIWDMELSIGKCSVLHLGLQAGNYTIDGNVLPMTSVMKDLGVLMSPSMRYTEHITEVAKKATRLCNMISRAFDCRIPSVYVTLYQTIVLPVLMYCSEVWSPTLIRDINLLQKIQDKFIKRIAWKCGVARNSIVLPQLQSLRNTKDQKMLSKILASESKLHFFDLREAGTRSEIVVRARTIAHTDKIAQQFSWRVSKAIHET
jgi:ribonuclease P/MRP protein subunit RPP40